MFFSLDVLRARKGDCLMLHYGSDDEPHLILIDGGPSDVYGPHLKPRLRKIHEARDLDERRRCRSMSSWSAMSMTITSREFSI